MKKYSLLILLIVTLSLDLGAQQGWKYQNSNLTKNYKAGALCAINKDTAYIIADSSNFLKTHNGGINWISQNSGFFVSFFDLSFCNADTGYAVGQLGTIIRTFDGGTNWTTLPSGTLKDLYSICTKDPDNLWVVGDSGTILNSQDQGNTWISNNSLTNKQLNSVCWF